ncbi:hypothetical protein [Micavibrio aeruginosavorus]|uniref:Uncharacterized protein n=1 Tax=Micavibrio aeruginosavorus (strain ARL-13) TaxID=856793 RepID=G2KLZ0_MICAA|nr:hypothetical protein [Micavibrio aeruginosavorus]AEP09686.1 hypothetical protein MICA_1364 [Micavibrio aeruginosavorus ARL-13]
MSNVAPLRRVKKAGMLTTMRVELPYATAEDQAKADKLNAEIKHLGVRTVRSAYDWGVTLFNKPKADKIKFETGDLVKVFKTVTDGDVQWEGTVDYDRSQHHHGLQKGMKPEAWQNMFYARLPARLERKDGTVLFGALEPFCETGTEGVIWSVHEYGKASYDGLNCLEEGDELTVYKNVRDGEIEWQGALDFGPEKVEKIGWSEIFRQTLHVPTQDWLQMSWENRPVIVEARNWTQRMSKQEAKPCQN